MTFYIKCSKTDGWNCTEPDLSQPVNLQALAHFMSAFAFVACICSNKYILTEFRNLRALTVKMFIRKMVAVAV